MSTNTLALASDLPAGQTERSSSSRRELALEREKQCATCGIVKLPEDFRLNNGRLRGSCRVCERRREKARRATRKPSKSNYQAVKNLRARNRKYIEDYKSGRACLDCGGHFKTYQMDFDHVRGTSKFVPISTLAWQASLERLEREIAKCDLVCANCHRVRTFEKQKQHRAYTRDLPVAL